MNSPSAISTQSGGVPWIAKRLAPTLAMRTGSEMVSARLQADFSKAGAEIHTSSVSSRAIASRHSSPGASMPSSLVSRMRMSQPFGSSTARPAI